MGLLATLLGMGCGDSLEVSLEAGEGVGESTALRFDAALVPALECKAIPPSPVPAPPTPPPLGPAAQLRSLKVSVTATLPGAPGDCQASRPCCSLLALVVVLLVVCQPC